MEIYLPIAEMSVNGLLIIALGVLMGMLSGIFGVGGGFAMTPILIFLGISPAIAVSTQANQLVAASVSGTMAHSYRKNVDFKMGFVMLIGGGIGSILGVYLFHQLQKSGHIDQIISLFYIVILTLVSVLMLFESFRTMYKSNVTFGALPSKGKYNLLHRLPFKMKFPRSKLYISALLPISIGFIGGILVAIMGIGGGFLMVPAMMYIIGMPVSTVAGTSLFQIIFSTAIVTFLQAATNHTVDVVLAFLLLVGGVIGAQFGTKIGLLLKGEHMRVLLAFLILSVAIGLGMKIAIAPDEMFDVEMRGVE